MSVAVDMPYRTRRNVFGQLTKRCSGCGLEYRASARKPLTTYFWRQAREPDGLRARCKLCCRECPCMQHRIAKRNEV